MSQPATTQTLDTAEVAALNARFAGRPPQELVAWALERFGRRVALSSSFGAEDVALIDMLWRIDPNARIVTLDTWRLPNETYDLIDRIRARYGMAIEVFYPDVKAVDEMVKVAGYNLFYQSVENRKLCCGIRKVEPLGRALSGLDAWISGMRRDQVVTRTEIDLVEIDDVHGDIAKLNPLAEWTSEQVWDYIHAHDVPYNALHDQGYPSIGCAPCTRAVAPGEDPRAGRWWWELDPTAKECGIHIGYDLNNVPYIMRDKEAAAESSA
ncbi:MAG: phosphoadenosine phosphosulfate reductase [Chloroflexota bacterium]|jgi:phosphoadenosine phosphosulfate reductase|nr:phosphoadenosine phosphosulfate reductase [Chloroflexota bacterium]